jgi:hypothetical protein
MVFVMDTRSVFCEEHSSPFHSCETKIASDESAPPGAKAKAVCVLVSHWLPLSSTGGPSGAGCDSQFPEPHTFCMCGGKQICNVEGNISAGRK